jgi:hypothetical protein
MKAILVLFCNFIYIFILSIINYYYIDLLRNYANILYLKTKRLWNRDFTNYDNNNFLLVKFKFL